MNLAVYSGRFVDIILVFDYGHFLMSDSDKISTSTPLEALFGNSASGNGKSDSSLDSLLGKNPSASHKHTPNGSNSLDVLFGNSAASPTLDNQNNPLLNAKESHSDSSPLDALFSTPANDVHFCKDCRFFIPHPYHCRCALTEKVVSPTDDCPNFEIILAPAK